MGEFSRMWVALAALTACCLPAQVIRFESGGLKYQSQSKQGVTVMFAQLPAHLRYFAILQVGVMNGSQETCTVRPEDFSFARDDGTVIFAEPARTVVDHLLDHAGRDDVIKLISTYEMGLSGITRFRSTNGYEQRRQAFLAEMGSTRLKAAATASAIAFVSTRLAAGASTDGAVFFMTGGKPLGPGYLKARAAGQIFEFESEGSSSGKVLQQRPAPPSPAN